jgi:chromosome partitioning protein
MPSHTKILAIANQKGGVGKTTTAVNLATGLAAIGTRTLLIDFDPQGNASTSFGIESNQRKHNIYGVLTSQISAKAAIQQTDIPTLDIITATVDLAACEIELSNIAGREALLKQKLEKVVDDYEYIIIDCAPSLGLLTVNALIAATSVLIPLQAEFFAMEGLAHLLQTLELVRAELNPDLTVEGIVLTMVDKRNNLSTQVEEEVRLAFPGLVYKTVIPRNIRLSEAPSHGKPALIYDSRCLGSQAYIILARELLKRNAVNIQMTEANENETRKKSTG